MDRQRFLELIEPALKLVVSKGEDYNANAIQLKEYFPFKDKSYQQMLHMKVLRMRSLLDRATPPNHDSLLDSVYDLVNYTVFYLDYLNPKDSELGKAQAAQNTGMTSGLSTAWRKP